VADQEQRYANCIEALTELKKEFDNLSVAHQHIVDDISSKLTEKQEEAQTKYTEFVKFKRLTSLAAENSRTGKPIPKKVGIVMECCAHISYNCFMVFRFKNNWKVRR
jgi:hypothetical protein